MEEELSKWKEDVKSQRESFYELNFYTTLQLLTLRRELGRLKEPGNTVTISPEVLALLQSISTQVGPSHVISAVNQILQEAKTEPEPKPAPVGEAPPDSQKDIEEKKADDAVEVASTKRASEDMDTPESKEKHGAKQGPMFSEDDLSEELKGYITTISSRVDCSRKRVLEAFKVLGKTLTRIDYENWCVDNMDNYVFDDEETSSEEESSGSESDSDSADDTSPDDTSPDDQFNYVPGTCVLDVNTTLVNQPVIVEQLQWPYQRIHITKLRTNYLIIHVPWLKHGLLLVHITEVYVTLICGSAQSWLKMFIIDSGTNTSFASRDGYL